MEPVLAGALLTAVHEDVLLTGMAMHVAEDEHLPPLLELLKRRFGVVDGGVELP